MPLVLAVKVSFENNFKKMVCLPLSPGVVEVVICKRTGCQNSVCYDVPRPTNQQANRRKDEYAKHDSFTYIAFTDIVEERSTRLFLEADNIIQFQNVASDFYASQLVY